MLELRVYSPTAILGYGFPLESLKRAQKEGFDVIAVDAGSTDPGPYYLGSGTLLVPEKPLWRDLHLLLKAAIEQGVPLIIGSAGGAGSKIHVDKTVQIVKGILGEMGKHATIGYFYTDLDKAWLQNAEESLEPADPHVAVRDIENTVSAVFQAGVEPYLHLLDEGADVIVGGRSVDPAPFAALPWLRGFEKGLSIHMGKILECGALAADPAAGSDGMMAVIRRGEFMVYPVNPDRRATVTSVVEHALYERRNPWVERVPGGLADMSGAVYEEAGEGVVVRGTRWVPEPYKVKIEGARLAGYRVVVFAGSRDPEFISRLDTLLDEALDQATRLVPSARIYVRVYGRDAVLGPAEPVKEPAHEVGILVEAVAPTRGEAKAAAAIVRSRLLHAGWPGRKTTSGNLAFPFSPSDIEAGPVYEWSLWHLVPVDPPGPVRYGLEEV